MFWTSLEIFALVFAVLILWKIGMVVFRKQCLVKLGDFFVGKHTGMQYVYLGLAILIGYYIFQYLSIIDVAAVMLFTMLLMAVGFMAYWDIMAKTRKKVLRRGLGKMWISILIWVALAVWTLYALFA